MHPEDRFSFVTGKKKLIFKILSCNSQIGFRFESREEQLLWFKYKFFEKGIGPNEFNKMKISDIENILGINHALEVRERRDNAIKSAVASMT